MPVAICHIFACRACLPLLVFFSLARAQQPPLHRVVDIRPQRTPTIEAGKVLYSLTITFDDRPENYMAYFEKRDTALVLEFYGIKLDTGFTVPQMSIPFKSVELDNIDSHKSIHQTQGQISISLSESWYYRHAKIEGESIRLVVWNEFNPQFNDSDMQKPFYFYLVVTTMAGLLSFGALFLSIREFGN
ncbi:MAG: hypothetical protein GF398_19630 [Chitinivibrionales bacterium]|nr:hypothetical protein [Chitinivibrionales bacterium]